MTTDQPNAPSLLRTLRSYAAHQYEGGGNLSGPWPNDPDGGEMRIILALDMVLCHCAQHPDYPPYGDLVREVGELFAGEVGPRESHPPTLERIEPPWDAETVDALNGYQAAGVGHPFTCPRCPGSPSLVATPGGWCCRGCDYTQQWAHAFMTTEEARTWPASLADKDECP